MDNPSLRNHTVLNELLDINNVPLLEEILNKELKLFGSLKGKKLDFSPIPKKEELDELFEEVKDEVDRFLHIAPLEGCSCRYKTLWKDGRDGLMKIPSGTILLISSIVALSSLGITTGTLPFVFALGKGVKNYIDGWNSIEQHQKSPSVYANENKEIQLNKNHKESLIPTIAHEYAHFVQEMFGLRFDINKTMTEGHARCVERHVAFDRARKEDNQAYLFNHVYRTVPELRTTYLWLCRNFGLVPHKGLTKFRTESDNVHQRILKRKGRPSYYSVGTSHMLLMEKKHGKAITPGLIHYTAKLSEKL